MQRKSTCRMDWLCYSMNYIIFIFLWSLRSSSRPTYCLKAFKNDQRHCTNIIEINSPFLCCETLSNISNIFNLMYDTSSNNSSFCNQNMFCPGVYSTVRKSRAIEAVFYPVVCHCSHVIWEIGKNISIR